MTIGPSRRDFLARTGGGLGLLALADLCRDQGLLAADPLASRAGHHPARAKSVIWMFMYGAPSGIDTFDYKPALAKRHGQTLAGEVDVIFGNPGPILKSPFRFRQYGQTGSWVSEVFPHTAKHVDDLTFLRAVTADSNVHGPAVLQMNTGMTRVGYPSAGAWTTYGLGSANRNLPGFVVLYDQRAVPVNGPINWGSAFLPAAHQGVTFRPGATPVLHATRPADVTASRQRDQLDLLAQWNGEHAAQRASEADLQARIESYELAYRMQMAAPEATDLNREPERVKAMYGLDDETTRPFGTRLLMARRLVERGVRFVQVYHGGTAANWDAHISLDKNHRQFAGETDRPIAGFLADMKSRGLLDDTLVIWGAEFGRMPISQDRDGRDHNPHAFLLWMTGGGLKRGYSHGASDELGYKPAEKPVSVHDFHATLLHLFGLDHKRLTIRHNAREFRLTDVSGEVVRDIFA